MSTTSSKICFACGQDVAGKPRTKDVEGNYYCHPCYQEAAQNNVIQDKRTIEAPQQQTISLAPSTSTGNTESPNPFKSAIDSLGSFAKRKEVRAGIILVICVVTFAWTWTQPDEEAVGKAKRRAEVVQLCDQAKAAMAAENFDNAIDLFNQAVASAGHQSLPYDDDAYKACREGVKMAETRKSEKANEVEINEFEGANDTLVRLDPYLTLASKTEDATDSISVNADEFVWYSDSLQERQRIAILKFQAETLLEKLRSIHSQWACVESASTDPRIAQSPKLSVVFASLKAAILNLDALSVNVPDPISTMPMAEGESGNKIFAPEYHNSVQAVAAALFNVLDIADKMVPTPPDGLTDRWRKDAGQYHDLAWSALWTAFDKGSDSAVDNLLAGKARAQGRTNDENRYIGLARSSEQQAEVALAAIHAIPIEQRKSAILSWLYQRGDTVRRQRLFGFALLAE